VNKNTIWIIVIVLVLLLVGGFVWLYLRDKAPAASQSTISTTTSKPQIKVTDFAQGAPANQKTEVLIEHSDSTFEKVILLNTMVDSYVSGLAPGEKVVSKTSMQ
jgi:hypothetical protein